VAGSRVTAVIPTLGRSPWLGPCLEALRRDAPEIEIVLIDQGEKPVETDVAQKADKTFRLGRNLGFASATNLGITASTREFVATVNDDALVEPGWIGRLVEALDREPRAAAAQGVNLILDSSNIADIADIADGCGIAWNRWTQAVQVRHGEPAPDPADPVRDIFGVSATAALYRRQALPEGPFDQGLVSYYEDVDLAVRLRAAGWKALLVPAARARHAGSVTGATLSRERWRLLYGNRWIVARRAFGGKSWLRMAVRDLLDLLRAALSLDGARVAGILGGWVRAVRF
jgi:GT2 family glycosyltransferase